MSKQIWLKTKKVFYILSLCLLLFSTVYSTETGTAKPTHDTAQNTAGQQTGGDKIFMISLNSTFLVSIGLQLRAELKVLDQLGIAVINDYLYWEYLDSAGVEINWYPGGRALNSFFIGAIGGLNWYLFDDNGLYLIPLTPLMDTFYGAHLGYRWILNGFAIDVSAGVKNHNLRSLDLWGHEFKSGMMSYDPQINIGWAW